MGFPGGASGKEPTCQCRRCKRCGFNAWVGKIPPRRKWQPTLVSLPGRLQSMGSQRVRHDWTWNIIFRLMWKLKSNQHVLFDNINIPLCQATASQVVLVVKNLPANAGDIRDLGYDPWVWKISWRRAWQPTQPAESHGQRSLVGMGLQRVRHNWTDLACAHTRQAKYWCFDVIIFFLLGQLSLHLCHLKKFLPCRSKIYVLLSSTNS